MKGPWYISAAAVRDYLRLTGQPAVLEGPIWDAAEVALMDISIGVSRKQPKVSKTGALVYNTGRASNRIRLVVSTAKRVEGAKPQLVQVLPRSGR